MNTNTESNENWGTCPVCGQPVLIDPTTGAAEPCATCAMHASKTVPTLGTVWILAGVAAIAALVYLCIVILL